MIHFSLLNLLEKLLSLDDSDIEEKTVEWVNILITGHYLQMVMSKDEELDLTRTRLQETVSKIMEKLKIMTDCRVTIKNFMNTKDKLKAFKIALLCGNEEAPSHQTIGAPNQLFLPALERINLK